MPGTDSFRYRPIGIIRSPFEKPAGTPIQPAAAKGAEGRVEVFEEYGPGLKDIEGFSHIMLIYHFHLVGNPSLQVTPFMDDQVRGIFSTRAPSRPNPIGISVVELLKVDGLELLVRDVDVVDGSPLLDIKPFVPSFDNRETDRIGWLRKNISRLPDKRDDGRFS